MMIDTKPFPFMYRLVKVVGPACQRQWNRFALSVLGTVQAKVTSTGRFKARRSSCLLALLVITTMALLGLTATSASALNSSTYTMLQNGAEAGFCLDIRTEDSPDGARAHLWNCTHVPEQQFVLVPVAPNQPYWMIKVQRSGFCLQRNLFPGEGNVIYQKPCDLRWTTFWELQPGGRIVDTGLGQCLDAPGNRKDADVVVNDCNLSITQKWLV